jgi:serine phosphatase RsbU (regulator of sigma subunit)
MEYLLEGGMALGTFENSKYEERPLSLSSGDLIVLYTDGVTEAKSETEEEFGTKRLKQVIKDSHRLSASEIQNNIYQAIKDFTGNLPQADDLTMIVIKVRD